MRKVILVRYGEILLKGLNRPVFEDKLMKNIKRSLYGLGKIKVKKSQSRIYVEPEVENYDLQGAVDRLTKVFGIVSVSIVSKIETNFDVISKTVLEVVEKIKKEKKVATFKVVTKRGNKHFPMTSQEINCEIGGIILDNNSDLAVDVNNPDFTVYIEVREETYIYTEKIEGSCGMPVGTNGRAMLLLSGGIDSPVAGWSIAKRGVEIQAVHFYSYPYTSQRAKDKVIELAKIVSKYCYGIKLHIVPFTDIQLQINDRCPQEEMTIIMRRAMMKIAEKIALKEEAMALITGESIGQVASQTMNGLYVTDNAVNMPVFRPLIGMDKNDVIEIARKIDTFETSILPYEDCCTVFVAKHPNTKPKLSKIQKFEQKLDLDELIETAIANTEVIEV